MDKKLTLLERYWKIRLEFESVSKETPPSPSQLWSYQELLYRIEILDCLQLIVKAAPFSCEMKTLFPHYQVVNMIFENLRTERFLKAPNPDMQKQQHTAAESLSSIIEDCRKRYASYAPAGLEQYQKDMQRTVATVLPAWIQYRNTVTEIKISVEEASQ